MVDRASDGDRVTKPYHIGWRPSQPASRPWRWRDRRPRRPWQSEGGTLRFARRGFTAEGAERAMKRDIAHLRRTGKSSPKQRWLVWRVSWVARRMVKRGECFRLLAWTWTTVIQHSRGST